MSPDPQSLRPRFCLVQAVQPMAARWFRHPVLIYCKLARRNAMYRLYNAWTPGSILKLRIVRYRIRMVGCGSWFGLRVDAFRQNVDVWEQSLYPSNS